MAIDDGDVTGLLAMWVSGDRSALDRLLTDGLVTPRTWTDSYLAAFAMTEGARLISFDTDFQRYPDLDLLPLEP